MEEQLGGSSWKRARAVGESSWGEQLERAVGEQLGTPAKPQCENQEQLGKSSWEQLGTPAKPKCENCPF